MSIATDCSCGSGLGQIRDAALAEVSAYHCESHTDRAPTNNTESASHG